jgi:D-3-phosphoglycerate dehydrogenase
MTRVAVPNVSFCNNPTLRAEVLKKYPDAKLNDSGKQLQGDALVEFLKGYDKALTGLEILDDALLARLPDLKVVSKYGVGLDMVDLEALRRRGIKMGWTGGVNKRSVAELVVAFAIALLRHIPQTNAKLRNGEWHRPAGRHLGGRVFGIIGCGFVGKELVRLLSGFGCKILVHDTRSFPEFYAEHKIRPVSLETLLRESDLVTLHVPLDKTTRNMLSAERLALMRPDAVLINAARGGLVDEAALKVALRTGKLAAAALDVFMPEPPTDMDLLSIPNLLATPHIGGSAVEAILAMGRAAIAGLENAGDPIEISSVMG